MVAGVGDDLALALRLLHHDLDNTFALFLGEGPEFAHRPGAEDAVHTEAVGEMPHVAPQTGFVEIIVRRERRGNRRPHAAELGAGGLFGFRLAIIHLISFRQVISITPSVLRMNVRSNRRAPILRASELSALVGAITASQAIY